MVLFADSDMLDASETETDNGSSFSAIEIIDRTTATTTLIDGSADLSGTVENAALSPTSVRHSDVADSSLISIERSRFYRK